MKSIIQDKNGTCYLCGQYKPLEEHHVYGGALRPKSERLGLKVYLCYACHNEPPNGLHFNANNMLKLKQDVQRKAMDYYGWTIDDFRREFYKNYL